MPEKVLQRAKSDELSQERPLHSANGHARIIAEGLAVNLYEKWLALPEETKFRIVDIAIVILIASVVFAGQML